MMIVIRIVPVRDVSSFAVALIPAQRGSGVSAVTVKSKSKVKRFVPAVRKR